MIFGSCKYVLIATMVLTMGILACKKRPSIDDHTKSHRDVLAKASIKLIFINDAFNDTIPAEYISRVTLIRYDRQDQDDDVEIKRWAGDTSGKYKYVEIEQKDLALGESEKKTIQLDAGFYKIKHNSVSGQPPSGFYGESELFEMKEWEEVKEIRVVLYPAI